jgi:hypothetical protein
MEIVYVAVVSEGHASSMLGSERFSVAHFE